VSGFYIEAVGGLVEHEQAGLVEQGEEKTEFFFMPRE
jgi:hypothetical protein